MPELQGMLSLMSLSLMWKVCTAWMLQEELDAIPRYEAAAGLEIMSLLKSHPWRCPCWSSQIQESLRDPHTNLASHRVLAALPLPGIPMKRCGLALCSDL